MKSATAVKDHVCGMDIETATAPGKSDYKGQTYYFCSSKCKDKFDLKPEQYLLQVWGDTEKRAWLLRLASRG